MTGRSRSHTLHAQESVARWEGRCSVMDVSYVWSEGGHDDGGRGTGR